MNKVYIYLFSYEFAVRNCNCSIYKNYLNLPEKVLETFFQVREEILFLWKENIQVAPSKTVFQQLNCPASLLLLFTEHNFEM